MNKRESELKKKWEEWYGDVVSGYQWSEFEYKGRKVLYVSGRFLLSDDGNRFTSTFTQFMGYADSDEPFTEEERKEIKTLFCREHGVENISFWGHYTPT